MFLHSPVISSATLATMAKSLGSSVFRATLTSTVHVKLVSMVVRGERVREEKAVVLEDWLMVIRLPDTISTSSLSRQVKENKMFSCVSTIVRSNRAKHVRVTSSAPPARRGPERPGKDTAGVGTAIEIITQYRRLEGLLAERVQQAQPYIVSHEIEICDIHSDNYMVH